MLDYSINYLRKLRKNDFNPFTDDVLEEIKTMNESDFNILCTYIKSLINKKEDEIKDDLIKGLFISNDYFIDAVIQSDFSSVYIDDSHILFLVKQIIDNACGPTHRLSRILVESGAITMERLSLMTDQFNSYKSRLLAEEFAADNIDEFLLRVEKLEKSALERKNAYMLKQLQMLNSFFNSEIYERISEVLQMRSNGALKIFDYIYHSQMTGNLEHEICYISSDENFPLFIEHSATKERENILVQSCVDMFCFPGPGQYSDVFGIILSGIYNEELL